MSTPELDAALILLSAEDPAAAVRASDALDELARWGPELMTSTLAVENFALALVARRPARAAPVCAALARLLELAGHDRAATLCADPAWHAAAERVQAGPDRAEAVLTELSMRPLQPPRLIDFQWRPDLGQVEAEALRRIAERVESVLDGAHPHGSHGPAADVDWHARGRALLRSVLDERPTGDRTRRAAIEHERLVDWHRSHGRSRSVLVDRVLDDLAQPIDPPSDAAETMVRVLAVLAPGPRRGIPSRLGWFGVHRRSRRSSAVLDVARRCGLVSRSDGAVTELGRALALSPTDLWRHVCAWSLAGPQWSNALRELLLLRLLDRPRSRAEVLGPTLAVARQEGLLSTDDPHVVATSDEAAAAWVGQTLDEVVRLGDALHLWQRGASGRSDLPELSDLGWWTAVAMLRGRAVGPRAEFLPLGETARPDLG